VISQASGIFQSRHFRRALPMGAQADILGGGHTKQALLLNLGRESPCECSQIHVGARYEHPRGRKRALRGLIPSIHGSEPSGRQSAEGVSRE